MCPAETSPLILESGEWLGNIEIVKPVMILQSSTLYEALHQRQRVYLKVAHVGEKHIERLTREADFLWELQQHRELNEYLPTIVPPYSDTTIVDEAYGRAIVRNQLLHYYLFEYVPGEPLRDALAKRPQPWINHIGWIIISLSSTIELLQSKGMLHLALSPDAVLVRFEDHPSVPRVLLFDLGVVTNYTHISQYWYPTITRPAYTAPELVEGLPNTIGYTSDVYGLGLILYELLVGEPVFRIGRLNDTEVYRAVHTGVRITMTRDQDVGPIAEIARQAVSLNPSERQPDAMSLTQQLKNYFGAVPNVRRGWWPRVEILLLVVLALLAIAFFITLIITLGSFNSFARLV